jgi:hypothetical protein
VAGDGRERQSGKDIPDDISFVQPSKELNKIRGHRRPATLVFDAMERRYHASRLGGFEVSDEFVPCTGWSAG